MIKYKKTKFNHNAIDLFRYYSNDRLIVPDEDAYNVFKSYLMPLGIDTNDTKCSSFSYNFDEKYTLKMT